MAPRNTIGAHDCLCAPFAGAVRPNCDPCGDLLVAAGAFQDEAGGSDVPIRSHAIPGGASRPALCAPPHRTLGQRRLHHVGLAIPGGRRRPNSVPPKSSLLKGVRQPPAHACFLAKPLQK